MSPTLMLTGLDGQNPLAFFAALGLLRVLDDHARRSEGPQPRLWFKDDGRQVACLATPLDFEHTCRVVLEDARSEVGAHALSLAYDEEGRPLAPDHAGAIRDLKPAPEVCRGFLLEAQRKERRSADFGAAFFSDLIQDNKGNTKPTALHFTAGQQEFLKMVGDLRSGLERAHLDEALLGPWRSDTPLPSLSWDATTSRQYALRATDPSDDKRGSVPAANWLAFIALTIFPVQAAGARLSTTGVVGGWKDSVFRWPVWSVPASLSTVSSLMRGEVAKLRGHEREALGVSRVFQAGIIRSDQGGYGSFTPSAVLPPRRS